MRNRLLPYLAVSAILLALAIMVDRSYKDTYLLQQYADEIALYTNDQAAEAKAWIEGRRSWLERLSTMNAAERNATSLNERLALADKPYTILLHTKDTVFFWSNNKIIPGSLDLTAIERQRSGGVIRLPVGYFVCLNEPIGEMTASALIPLRYTQNDPGASPFAAEAHIPSAVQLSESQTPYAVRIGDRDLTWLRMERTLQPMWVQILKFTVYGLLAILALVWLFRGADALARRFGKWAGLALPLLLIGLFWWADNQFYLLNTSFSGLPLFNVPFEQSLYVGRSLGAALVHIALLLWWMVFFHRITQDARIGTHQASGLRMAGAIAGYLGIMLSVLFSVDLFRQLVLQTSIDFNFNNIVRLNAFSFAALAGIILMLAGFFLWSHRISVLVRETGLANSQRVGAQLVALALFVLAAWAYPVDLHINLLYLAGFGLIYVLVLEAFVAWQESSFVWTIIWLLCFSGFATFLVNRFNSIKDRQTRSNYALALADNRDADVAEPLLRIIHDRIKSDPQLPLLLKPWPFKPETAELEQYFNRFAFQEQYLFEHYRVQVFAFDAERQPLLREQTASWEQVAQLGWETGIVLKDHPDIRYQIKEDGVFRYWMRFRVERMNDPTQPADVFLSLEHVFAQAARAYTRQFFKDPYKNLQQLSEYDFAVFSKERLVVDRGQSSNTAGLVPVAKGEVREVSSQEPPRIDAVARSADGSTLAIVGRETGAWYRQVYLFAILFTLASIFLFILAILNTYLDFLPESFHFLLKSSGSLSRRIQYGTSAVLIPAFLLIGLMTYRHFSTSAVNAQRADFNQRSEAVLNHLRTKFGEMTPGADSLWAELPSSLNPLLSSLNLDANLYAADGSLLYANQDALRRLGLVPLQIGTPVMEKLRSSNAPALDSTEPLGGQELPVRYMPLRNGRNQLLGYLSLPYLPERQAIGPEVSEFMGMLASLYVFLLLVAGVATLMLARSIIRPIRLISDKIKELHFEDKNQPLDYQGDRSDELGELIEEYNRMVDKLEDSKVQLIRLEREGAWREMARQIAHDIKNPLTTMKLSMQQLERVSNDPMQAAAYLKKAITRLIEQIDSLAQIASEFSMFANLDIQHRHDLVLNDVVESVYDLFTEQKEVELRLNLPEERIHISGDKSHLIRVFNNLVINAIQAIPEGRKGKISVLLYRKADKAVVQIRDNGGGIPPDIQKRVFEPNFTTKSSGSGLGLAICRRIVEALDGAIRFETRQGEGTDFYVEMPITSVE